MGQSACMGSVAFMVASYRYRMGCVKGKRVQGVALVLVDVAALGMVIVLIR